MAGSPAKPVTLTETAIAKAIKTAKEAKTHKRLPDPGKRGLWLSVGQTDTPPWEARNRVAAEDGAPRWIALDSYPGVGLLVARDRYDVVRVSAKAGTSLTDLRRMFKVAPVVPLQPEPPPTSSPPSPDKPAPDSLSAKLNYEAKGDPGKSWPHSNASRI